MTQKVFVSYSSRDSSIAEELEKGLERLGIAVFRDHNIMRGGGDWEDRIIGLIDECDKFIILWSIAAAESVFVTQELIRALSKKLDIIPIRLDESASSPLLKSVHEFDGRFGLNKVFDALAPNVQYHTFFGQHSSAIIRSYKRLLSEELSHFTVLLSQRDDSTKHVIRLHVTDELMGDEQETSIGRESDVVSILENSAGEFTLLIGHPGSGKTTSARYLAQHLLEHNDLHPHLLPFLGHCRQFNPKKYDSILGFLYTQAGYLLNFPISEALRESKLAQQPGAVLIVDGFDELPSGTVEIFLEQLHSLRENPDFKGYHVLLTSRFDAYRQFEDHFVGWRKLALAPLILPQIQKFIHNWFNGSDISAELCEQIKEPRLAELAMRPFLLAMICLVRENGGDLGRNRSELYSNAIAYLERRQAMTIAATDRELRHQILQDLAMQMLRLGEADLDRWTVAGVAASAFFVTTGTSPSTLEDCLAFVDSLTRDIGITQRVLGHYSFVHRTFMEYLAACKLNESENGTAIAVEHCNVVRWEEPIRLYAGMQTASAKQVDIVKQLWCENPALALRALTDARTVSRAIVESFIATSDSSERVRMLRTLRTSFRDVDRRTRLRLVLETTEPLLASDTNNEVVYNAVSLLKWVDPNDHTRILWRAFGADSASKRQELIRNTSMYFNFAEIPDGTFIMGDNQAIDAIEKPAHLVTVSAFKITRHQITNIAYEFVINRSSLQRHPNSNRDRQPVVGLNWFDAYIFALRIGCRLPTEAEWEYAARAGSTTAWCFGDDLSSLSAYANFEEEGHAKAGPWDVGSGRPNAFGLHDMHGNVWEWCADWLGPYASEPATDPKGPENGSVRVRRGGGFAYHSRGCRSAFRWGNDPSYQFKDIGVRVVLDETAVNRGW